MVWVPVGSRNENMEHREMKPHWIARIATGLLVISAWLMMGMMATPSWAKESGESMPSAIATGEQIFEVHCAGCHLNGGNIIRRGKNLKMRALRRNHMDSVEAIAHITTYGKRPMSAYQDTLSKEEIHAVSAFVLDRAKQGW